MIKAEVLGVFGIPGAGKSTISELVATRFDAISMDNDIHGYPPSVRIRDAARLGLESIDAPSAEMAALSREHASAFEHRVRDIARQGNNVVMQGPQEAIGHRRPDGSSLVAEMSERFDLAQCRFSPSFIVPLPQELNRTIRDTRLSPDELEELLRKDDFVHEVGSKLDERFKHRGTSEEQRSLDAPKIGNLNFIRERLSRVAKSMRDSDIPAVPVFLGEEPRSSAERVIALHESLRGKEA